MSQVIEYIKDGKLLKKPDDCTDELYELMLGCWHTQPSQRMTMSEIHDLLCNYLAPDSPYNNNSRSLENRECQRFTMLDVQQWTLQFTEFKSYYSITICAPAVVSKVDHKLFIISIVTIFISSQKSTWCSRIYMKESNCIYNDPMDANNDIKQISLL